MKKAELLMIPGPTPLPEPVRAVMNAPAMGHRSAEFKEVLKRVFPNLQRIFKTENQVLLYTASGTGAMEAAMINTLNQGDRILILTNGVFSHRWVEIADTLGYVTETLDVPMGQAHQTTLLQDYLVANKDIIYKAILLTHSETSTGVSNKIAPLTEVIRASHPEALVIVDTVTSLASAEFDFDSWGIDIAVSGSQKGFMLPPGLSFLALSDRAWQAHQLCKNPGYYFNFSRYKKAQAENTTPYTPATHLILGLDVALEMMLEEGLSQIVQRHWHNRQMLRAGLKAMGLELFVKNDTHASLAVTSFSPPEGLSVNTIRQDLKTRFGIVIADGQKSLKGKIMRIGHLGYVGEREVLATLAALEAVFANLGVKVPPGAGVAAAIAVPHEKEVAHVV
jgi:aspartate aminotransferase-like enzyme